MSFTDAIGTGGFSVSVATTSHRGFIPAEVAARCTNRIVAVADTAPPAIRQQAEAFRGHVEKVVEFYMQEAVNSDRTTVCNALTEAGHPELATLIRSL